MCNAPLLSNSYVTSKMSFPGYPSSKSSDIYLKTTFESVFDMTSKFYVEKPFGPP
jgi:hypothetical protein